MTSLEVLGQNKIASWTDSWSGACSIYKQTLLTLVAKCSSWLVCAETLKCANKVDTCAAIQTRAGITFVDIWKYEIRSSVTDRHKNTQEVVKCCLVSNIFAVEFIFSSDQVEHSPTETKPNKINLKGNYLGSYITAKILYSFYPSLIRPLSARCSE